MRNKSVLFTLWVMLALNALPMMSAQSFIEIIGRKEPIPSGYKTYSLFLICNPAWLDPAKSSGLTDLFHQFQAFGRSIGNDQAAVWFWKTTVQKGWENKFAPADVIDVERGTEFCKAWKLKPSDGPYIVVTTGRPDETSLQTGLPDNSAVFKLGDMQPSNISALLAKLTDSLVLSGKVDSTVGSQPSTDSGPGDPAAHPTTPPASSNASAASSALWIRMLNATQQIINDFGCAWTFKLDAGPLSADLKSCKGSS